MRTFALFAITASFVALTFATSLEASIIDNMPRNGTIQYVGESNTAYYAQSFEAPVSFAAGDLTFQIRKSYGNEAKFRILLTETVGSGNSIRPDINNILYEGAQHVLTSNTWHDITENLGGVALAAGTTYAWIIDAFAEFDNSLDKSKVGVRTGFSDGRFFYYNVRNGGTRADHFDDNWNDRFKHKDLAFRIEEHSTPEVTAIVVWAMLGLTSSQLTWRRRNR